MFGGDHPHLSGRAGLPSSELELSLPAFGAFGTIGHHCFDPTLPTFQRLRGLLEIRKHYPVLRYGRQYFRPISNFGASFAESAAGELIAWSRILDDEEALCVQ